MSNSLGPHGLHTRPLCPSLTPEVYSDSCPLSQWCHQTISSSVVFSSRLQFFTASGSLPVSQFFTSGGQSIGVSASASIFPVNIQDWFPLGWTSWISLQSKGLSRVLQHLSSKASILQCSALTVQLSHPYMTTGKTIALSRQTFVDKVMFLLLNMLSRLVMAFLPRSKRLLISGLQSPYAVTATFTKSIVWVLPYSYFLFSFLGGKCGNIQKPKIMVSGLITSWQIDGETVETVSDFILGGSKITADGDCSHEIKTLAPWKKSYDQPRQHIKKQRHYFANKGPYIQSYAFSVMYGCESWTIKKAEHWKIDAFDLWC